MDRIFKSHTGIEDAAMLREAQRDVGLSDALEETAIERAKGHDMSEKDDRVGDDQKDKEIV